MQSEFDRTQAEVFVRVALKHQVLTDVDAERLSQQANERSRMPAELAIELGMLRPVEVEIVEAFADPSDLAPGYELVSVLGHGALGVVYRAHQPRLRRDVAIKAIKQSSLSQPGAVARFQQEGAAIARLHHPNIVGAFDSGAHRGRLYLVMELVAGADLRYRLAEGPLEVRTAISIARQTAAGLAHALSHQIIHRDIKPGNLILTEASAGYDLPPGVPLVKIGDFGLAKLNPMSETAADDTQLTMTGAALGTPMYSAPEQLTGDQVDHRADIYALGATLFHALSGQTPFQADAVSKLVVAKVTGQQPRLDLLPGDVDPELRQLLLEMMEPDPDKRLPDYVKVIDRIDQLQQKAWSKADSTETIPQFLPPAEPASGKSKRKIAVVSTLALFAVAAALVLSAMLTARPAQPTMVPSGWELALFDGRTLTEWTDRSGLWLAGLDAEEASILVGKGSAVRDLPIPADAEPGSAAGIGFRIGIDLQQAPLAEVHFGFEGRDLEQSERLVAQISIDGVSLGTRQGIDGEYSRTGRLVELPTRSENASLYYELRIELHGDRWFLYLNGQRFGDAQADPAANNRNVQLVANQGTVHFDGPSVFGLRAGAETKQ